jgi:hypothetical protein
MPDQPLDIANLDNWYGFRPGMTRLQVMEGLKKLGLEIEAFSDDNLATTVNDHGVEFYFAMDGSERLRQVSLDSDDVSWNGKPLMDARLDDALRALEPFTSTPMWEASDAIADGFPDPSELPPGPVSDEGLLEKGTVWLPEGGLGLVICDAEVIGLAWRETRDLPARFAGPATEAQRQLSKRPDIEAYLREKRLGRTRAAAPKNPFAPLQTALVWVCLGMIAYVARLGFKEMKVWNTAPILSGKYVSLEKVPRKKHLDLGPEFLRQHMADDPTRYREMYQIEYLDPSGRPRTASIEGAEFYVPPRELGDEAQLAYVEGDPPRVKGPSRARDAAFVEYMPWAMAVGVFYLAGQFVLSFVPFAFCVLKGLAARKTTVDSDRPELR